MGFVLELWCLWSLAWLLRGLREKGRPLLFTAVLVLANMLIPFVVCLCMFLAS